MTIGSTTGVPEPRTTPQPQEEVAPTGLPIAGSSNTGASSSPFSSNGSGGMMSPGALMQMAMLSSIWNQSAVQSGRVGSPLISEPTKANGSHETSEARAAHGTARAVRARTGVLPTDISNPKIYGTGSNQDVNTFERRPYDSLRHFIDSLVDEDEVVTRIDVMLAYAAGTNDPDGPNKSQRDFFKFLLVVGNNILNKYKASNFSELTETQFQEALSAYDAASSAVDRRTSINGAEDKNNLGFIFNLIELGLGDNAIHASLGGGNLMSDFVALAGASEKGDIDTITRDDLEAIVSDSTGNYTGADKAFAQRLLSNKNLYARISRYDDANAIQVDGKPYNGVITRGEIERLAGNYLSDFAGEQDGGYGLDGSRSTVIPAHKLAQWNNATVDLTDRTYLTWSVEADKGMINLDNGFKIEVDTEKNRWFIHHPPDEDGKVRTDTIWGDPHVDLNNDGSTDFDFNERTTFTLPDGTKITVGVKNTNNVLTVSDTLTITSAGGQAVQVRGISSNQPEVVQQDAERGHISMDGEGAGGIDETTRDGKILQFNAVTGQWFWDKNADGKKDRDENKGEYDINSNTRRDVRTAFQGDEKKTDTDADAMKEKDGSEIGRAERLADISAANSAKADKWDAVVDVMRSGNPSARWDAGGKIFWRIFESELNNRTEGNFFDKNDWTREERKELLALFNELGSKRGKFGNHHIGSHKFDEFIAAIEKKAEAFRSAPAT